MQELILPCALERGPLHPLLCPLWDTVPPLTSASGMPGAGGSLGPRKPCPERDFLWPRGPRSSPCWGCTSTGVWSETGANPEPSSLPHQILAPSLSPLFGSPRGAHITEGLLCEEELDFVCIAPSLKSNLWKISERTVLAEYKDSI